MVALGLLVFDRPSSFDHKTLREEALDPSALFTLLSRLLCSHRHYHLFSQANGLEIH